MEDYKILLDFFNQLDDNGVIPFEYDDTTLTPLFELGKYSIEVTRSSGIWYIKIDGAVPAGATFSSKGEALLYVVRKWTEDQGWKLITPGEYRHKGNFILSYNNNSGDWDLYRGTKHFDSWCDPINAFHLSGEFLDYYEKRKSIRKRIKKIKQTIVTNKFKLSDESIEKASLVVVHIEKKFNARTGGLGKIEIVTLNSLYRSIGGT